MVAVSFLEKIKIKMQLDIGSEPPFNFAYQGRPYPKIRGTRIWPIIPPSRPLSHQICLSIQSFRLLALIIAEI